MKALCWHGVGDVRVDSVPYSKIEHSRDAIIKIIASGICGSDLHLVNGFMAAENCGIEPGDTVAVWGCGPVAQFANQSAWLLYAERVIAIDRVPERLLLAETKSRAETINFDKQDVYDRLMELTKGRGPDPSIDGVGCEAHAASTVAAVVDKAKEAVMLQGDRTYVLQEAIRSCREGGTISVPGAYVGASGPIAMGDFMNKGLTMKSGQTHRQRYMKPLREKIEAGLIDPSFVISHRVALADAPEAYKSFRDK